MLEAFIFFLVCLCFFEVVRLIILICEVSDELLQLLTYMRVLHRRWKVNIGCLRACEVKLRRRHGSLLVSSSFAAVFCVCACEEEGNAAADGVTYAISLKTHLSLSYLRQLHVVH